MLVKVTTDVIVLAGSTLVTVWTDSVVIMAVVVWPGREVVNSMDVVRSKVIVDPGKIVVKVLTCGCVLTIVVGTVSI